MTNNQTLLDTAAEAAVRRTHELLTVVSYMQAFDAVDEMESVILEKVEEAGIEVSLEEIESATRRAMKILQGGVCAVSELGEGGTGVP